MVKARGMPDEHKQGLDILHSEFQQTIVGKNDPARALVEKVLEHKQELDKLSADAIFSCN